jgi:imidazolonepropionase-like amidohydrolase
MSRRLIAPFAVACAGGFMLTVLAAVGQASQRPERKPGPQADPPRDTYSLPVSTYTPLPRHDTIIIGATILDGTGQRIENGSILLRDGKVVAIGPALAAPADAEVVEARGRFVTPGLIDPHAHMGNAAPPWTADDIRVWDVNEATDPNTANMRAEDAIRTQDPMFIRALAAGVTTVEVLPGSTNLFGGLGIVLKNIPATTVSAMVFPGATQAFKMASGENPKHQFGDAGRFPMSRMGVAEGQRDAWRRALDYRQRRQLEGRERRPSPRDAKLDAMVSALEGRVRVHIHVYRAEDMVTLANMAREFGFTISAFAHAVEGYKVPELFVAQDICALAWSDWWGFKMETYDGIRENAAFLDASGACVALHSDVATVGQHLNIEAAKAMTAGRRAGLTIEPERAIKWITSNAAKVLGLEDRIGSLTPGRNADLVLWSGDPFSVYSKPDLVFIDGAVAYDRANPSRQPRSDFELGQPAREVRR